MKPALHFPPESFAMKPSPEEGVRFGKLVQVKIRGRQSLLQVIDARSYSIFEHTNSMRLEITRRKLECTGQLIPTQHSR